jgi:hypothetical protein
MGQFPNELMKTRLWRTRARALVKAMCNVQVGYLVGSWDDENEKPHVSRKEDVLKAERKQRGDRRFLPCHAPVLARRVTTHPSAAAFEERRCRKTLSSRLPRRAVGLQHLGTGPVRIWQEQIPDANR